MDFKGTMECKWKEIKHLDLAIDLRMLRKISKTVIRFVIGALGTMPRDLEGKLGSWKSE